ncbi:IS110 family RNA-guided transposase [Nonomuraea turcica]|uniref:IS110 family transposase n=1 Tax=Nonomuraea sp. G32 TaxID=3067274 RepID=UPI00273BA4A9|nr:IS110 family transposase [Nonomuraea sp. G32]MDP4505113.1 IS110 family transposase [Nonomuraea sp. G32]
MSTAYDGQQYVGIDLHRRRSVIVRMTEDGRKLACVRIDNDPVALEREIVKAGVAPKVVLEATYGWYWAADVLEEAGAEVHLAHPLGVKAFSYRRVKNDERDAADLADLLRMGRLPEAWIAPPDVRELRELVRYRAKLVQQRTSCKDQLHAVLGKLGLHPKVSDLFGVGGRTWLAGQQIQGAYRIRIDSLLAHIALLDVEIDAMQAQAGRRLADHAGYREILRLKGVGPVLAAIFAAEIGDARRFRRAEQLVSWAGLTPKHHESDTKVVRGRITKQGSKLVRWAAVEAIQHADTSTSYGALRATILNRRGSDFKGVAKVAAARELLTLVYYGLRDGHIRCLDRPSAKAGA